MHDHRHDGACERVAEGQVSGAWSLVNSVEARSSNCAPQLGRPSRSLRRKAYVWIDVARGGRHRARGFSEFKWEITLMTPFTVATLEAPGGNKAAIGMNGSYYLLENIQPLLQPPSCKTLLETWDTSFPLLQELADPIATNGAKDTAGIPKEAAHLLAPVLYPHNLVAIGGNYAGHLKAMGLEVKKWNVMPFFIRPPKSTLVGPRDTVRIRKTTHQFDWECELAGLVGRRMKNTGPDDASAAIA